MKPIHKRQEVIQDLATVYAWIGERNPDAADRFLSAVDETFGQIGKHPGIGWQRRWKNSKLDGIRSWRVAHFPAFLIFYRDEPASIEIYGVLRGARHLESALKQR